MRTLLLIAAALAANAVSPPPALAQYYGWAYGGRPFYRPYYGYYGYYRWPYYAPPPVVYVPPPVFYAPPPVVYAPPPRWYRPPAPPPRAARVVRRRPVRRIQPKPPINPLLGPLAPATQTRARSDDIIALGRRF